MHGNLHVDGCQRWESFTATIQVLNVFGSPVEPKLKALYSNYFCNSCCGPQCQSKDPSATVRRVLAHSPERTERQLIPSVINDHTVVYKTASFSTANSINACRTEMVMTDRSLLQESIGLVAACRKNGLAALESSLFQRRSLKKCSSF